MFYTFRQTGYLLIQSPNDACTYLASAFKEGCKMAVTDKCGREPWVANKQTLRAAYDFY